MSSVAEQLRRAREAKHLSVEQVADLTKLRTDHVRALEEGRFNVFSATVYIRGSVKAYAKALKLDEKSLVTALDTELKATEKFSEPPPLTEQKKTIVDHLALVVAKLNWKMGFAGLALVVIGLLVAAGYFAWRHHRTSDPLKNLQPALYAPAHSGDTLPLPKR